MVNEVVLRAKGGELAGAGDLANNPAAVYLASLSPGSRRTMLNALNTMAAMLGGFDAMTCPWAALRFQHTSALRSQLAERYAAATVNKFLAALRGTIKAAWRLGLVDAENYTRAVDVAGVIGETLPAGRSLLPGELTALLQVCQSDDSARGVRDAAIIALLYSCGLRRAEVVNLDFQDYDAGGGVLAVRGKRNKVRLAHVVDGTRAALGDWLAIRGAGDGPLFVAVLSKGLNLGQRLSTHAVYFLVKRRAARAGIDDITCHDFRRSFVGDLLDAGADIVTVQRLAGHASVNTTARYDRRPEAVKRRAAQLLHVPYVRAQ